MASKSIRRQLGHGLLSHLNYTFKIDKRNSPVRPTSGFAFVARSQIGGIFPDYRSLRFVRQVCGYPMRKDTLLCTHIFWC